MVTHQRRLAISAVSLAVVSVWSASAYGETLGEAIVEAYQSNPVLQAQRYDLKYVDEAYIRAWSVLRPRADLQITGAYTDTRAGDTTQALRLAADPTIGRRLTSNNDNVRLVLEQLLYSGGQAASAIDASEYRVRAARETLRATEEDLLLKVVTVYEDILRDEASLGVRRENVTTLERQLEMTQARKKAGEVTLTDVEQASAQLEAGRAQVTLAEAQLDAGRAAYASVVGHLPLDLLNPTTLPLLPTSISKAADQAEESNPEILQAKYSERESQKLADQAKSVGHATVSAQVAYGVNGQISGYDIRDHDHDFTVGVTITKPLMSGGANASSYREALAKNEGDRQRIDVARRGVVQSLVAAWNGSVTARLNLQIQERQLRSAEIAAKGMQTEFRYGQRSTLDVLVAEQNLREAQLALINSRHDAYVADATILRHVGYLEARTLVVGLEVYDPSVNLRDLMDRSDGPLQSLVAALDRTGSARAKQASVIQKTPGSSEMATASSKSPPLVLVSSTKP